MRVGYFKLGRSMPLTPLVGVSDDEPTRLLRDLARRHPNDEFILLGTNSGESNEVAGLPPNVFNPWAEGWRDEFRQLKQSIGSTLTRDSRLDVIAWGDRVVLPEYRRCDALVGWIGQHGNSNSYIPPAKGTWAEDCTNTYDEFILYGSHMVRGVNAFRQADPLVREETWLVADARNYLKARDLKWPVRRPILGQYDFKRLTKFERYGDDRDPADCGFKARWDNDHIWLADLHYLYSRLEISGTLPWHVDTAFSDDWEGRRHFGLFINEARAYVGKGMTRLQAMRDYVLPLQPAFVHGKWPPASQKKLGIEIVEAPNSSYFDLLRTVRCTFTTPSSGSGWATTKPWQAFAVGTVCFFHPAYDSQNHILAEAPTELTQWLRVRSPEELKTRVDTLQYDRDAWLWLVQAQRRHYDSAVAELRHINMIEERIWDGSQGDDREHQHTSETIGIR